MRVNFTGHLEFGSRFNPLTGEIKFVAESQVGDTFDPPAGLEYWVKADSLQINDNEAVSIWEDSSGNNHATNQSTLELQPILKTNVVNGLPMVYLNGTTFLNHDVLKPGSDFTIFVVSRTSDGPQRRVISWQQGGNYLVFPWWDGTVGRAIHSSNGGAGFGLSTGFSNQLSVQTYRNQHDTVNGRQTYSNGELVDQADTGASDGNFEVENKCIGAFMAGVEHFTGYIGEIMVFLVALSDEERAYVEAYLADKWMPDETDSTLLSFTVDGVDHLAGGSETRPFSTSSVTVVATPQNPGSTVDIAGDSGLVTGDNTLTVTVTAPDGVHVTTYTVNIHVLNEGTKERTEFSTPYPGALGGEYLVIQGDSALICIWFNLDGQNSQPDLSGLGVSQYVEQYVTPDATAPGVMGNIVSSMTGGNYFNTTGSTDGVVVLTANTPGARPDAFSSSAINIPTSVTQQGADPS